MMIIGPSLFAAPAIFEGLYLSRLHLRLLVAYAYQKYSDVLRIWCTATSLPLFDPEAVPVSNPGED